MENWIEQISLAGSKVDLIPLEKKHKEALLLAASDGELWNLWYTSVPSEKNIDEYLATAFLQKQNGASHPFVVIDKSNGKIIGTTRYCNIDAQNKRLEIGYTWYAASYQKRGVNTECKFLLLKRAFENLGAVAVEFRTHWHNHSSRNAILRLGAKCDGVLRNHRMDKDGCFRDTVVFSIIESEWKTVRKSLEFMMQKKYPNRD